MADVERLEAIARALAPDPGTADVQGAMADLRQARLWLQQHNFDTRPELHPIVDRMLQLARERLNLTDEAGTPEPPD